MISGTINKWLVLVAIAALAAFVIACGTDETTLTPNNGVGSQPDDVVVGVPGDSDNDTVTTPRDPGYEVVEVLAPIESVQILVLEISPEQYQVQIVSGLPSGCAQFSRSDVVREGTTVIISVYNTQPAPDQQIACTAIYGMRDGNINLGSAFEGGTEYTVLVNDHSPQKFTAGSAALPKVDIPEDFVLEQAPIESLEIATVNDGDTTTYYADVTWGLTNGCRESHARVISQVDASTFDIQALVTAPNSGANVACTELYRTESDMVFVGSTGKELAACTVYSVTAGNKTVEFQAIAPNVRCEDPELTGGTAPDTAPTPTPAPPTGGGSLIADSQALEISLESNGADVELGGKSEFSSFFGLQPSEIKVNGASVQIYEFAPGTSAEEASGGVSADGTTIVNPDGSAMSMFWVAPPHFYLFGNAIVLYVGDDAEIGALLNSVANQFAGADFDSTIREVLGEAEFTTKRAVIEKVGIASTRSIPAQHLIGVTIALGGSCETFEAIEWRVEGREVIIDVTTQVPTAPVPCTLAIIYEDQSVNIGSDYETGIEYDVIVNGEHQGTFFGG